MPYFRKVIQITLPLTAAIVAELLYR